MYVRLTVAVLAVAAMILLIYVFPKKTFVLLTAAAYCLGLIYSVGFYGPRNGLGGVSFHFPMPFWGVITTGHFGLVAYRSVLNMLLFVPFGYLLPAVLRLKPERKIRWWLVVSAGLGTSLLIETCQHLFRVGVFELDDLVKNTMGAAIGCGIWLGLERLRNRRTKKRNAEHKEQSNADS